VGAFEKGDLVRIIAEGQYIGIGKISCDSQVARRNMGKKGQRAFIHYDYLYLE
jgi:glutamate 5-kinase